MTRDWTPPSFTNLPIGSALDALRAALAASSAAVLHAPPGAGKTTIVPLALVDTAWCTGKIIMLEPRRLAARAAARRMASLLGEHVGDTVGYRVRRDTRISKRTRIEVVTDGVLNRMLSTDPTLDGVSLVIFDEFHERSADADLGLALTIQTQRIVRPELRILVMSATLDVDPISRLLGGAPVVSSPGRMFSVAVRYVAPRAGLSPEAAVASTVRHALADHEGDVLAFLPGQAEIRRAVALLTDLPAHVDVLPLFGDLPLHQQDQAITAAPPGRRKVVIATSIAESSLTIEGVRIVIDAGLNRTSQFNANSGMTRLVTSKVSQASADQRKGRAGRLAPGACYRLWDESNHAALLPFSPPAIMSADLATMALTLATAGIRDPLELAWIDPPPSGPFSQARTLLSWLDAIDSDGRVTHHGRDMQSLGAHPRIAHMLLTARSLGLGDLAADLAGLLEERDVLRGDYAMHDPDAEVRVQLLRSVAQGQRRPQRYHDMNVNSDALSRAVQSSHVWRRDLTLGDGVSDIHCTGRVLALAYPDRIAQKRPDADRRFVMRNGVGTSLPDGSSLIGSPYLAVGETDGARPESRIYMAAALALDDLRADQAAFIHQETQGAWDDSSGRLRVTTTHRLGALALTISEQPATDSGMIQRALTDAVSRSDLALLNWTEAARNLQQRVAFLRTHDASWPDLSDEALVASLDEWLTPFLSGIKTAAELAQLDTRSLLLRCLTHEQRSELDHLAPVHIVALTGSRLEIDYSQISAPSVAVRLQEMFGCSTHPSVFGGRVPLTVHLLSPAFRPVQVTRDLPGFWRGSYVDVRKDLRGRYPKHEWPEDPLTAAPTRRAKPRRR